MSVLFGTFLFVAVGVSSTLACNGYGIKDFKLGSCGGSNDIVKADGLTVKLTEGCELEASGCLELTQPLNLYKLSYNVQMNSRFGIPLKHSDEMTICGKDDSSSGQGSGFDLVKMLVQCPIQTGKVCIDGQKVSIESFKSMLALAAGDYEGQVKGESDAGDLCLEVAFTLGSDGGMLPNMPSMSNLPSMPKLPSIG